MLYQDFKAVFGAYISKQQLQDKHRPERGFLTMEPTGVALAYQGCFLAQYPGLPMNEENANDT